MENHNTADPNFQHEAEDDMMPKVNQVSEWRCIAEDTEQQTPTHAYVEDETRNSFSSNNSSDTATLIQPLSPRTT
jgi:redox-sensitive bicupin YhaK (pirin superfamily)